MSDVVACGAVVWRRGLDDALEVLVVHRPRYADWSFAKGKIDRGETIEDCARREVFEETGFAITLGTRLPDVGYVDRRGRAKVVHYWAATPTEPEAFVPNDEVDEIRWLGVGDARATLTYDRDRELLDSLDALGAVLG